MHFSRFSAAGSTALLAATGLLLGSRLSPASNSGSVTAPAAADSTVTSTAPTNSPLQVMAEFNDPQMVGVAAAPDGKVFACFPRWDWNPSYPIAEVGLNNTLKPYPNARWCTWNDSAKTESFKHWICPQSVVADKAGVVWVIDPDAPGLKFTALKLLLCAMRPSARSSWASRSKLWGRFPSRTGSKSTLPIICILLR